MTDTAYSPARISLHLGLMCAGLFLVGTNAFAIAGLLPIIADGLQTTETSVSYSVTLYSLIIAVAAPVASVVLARVSRTVLMSAGLALLALGTLISAFAEGIVGFDAGRSVAAIGGALFVPTATAAGPSIVAPARSATAIAIVVLGFSLAVAVGAPVSAAVGTAVGWRVPFVAIGLLGFIVAAVVALVIRGVPLPQPLRLVQRLDPLRDRRIVVGLLAIVLLIVGFNAVYLRIATVAHGATNGDGGLLAILLAIFGAAGVVGTIAAGPLTDRFGVRRVLTGTVALQTLALIWIGLFSGSFWTEAVAFVALGVGVFASPIAVQEHLVTVDRPTASIAVSWASSAQYLGLAVAPILSAVIVSRTGAASLPLVGAAIIVLSAVVFYAGSGGGVGRRR